MTIDPMPSLTFHTGQRVMERIGNDKSAKVQEVEIISRRGRVVTTETGGEYDALTGASMDPGEVYRAIRSMTSADRAMEPKP